MSPTYDLAKLAARDAELAGRPMPTPAYSTARPAGLRSKAASVAATAELYGRKLIPWQLYAADLATCLNPPGSHLVWRYQTIVIVVPRQAGKTELAQSILVQRLFGGHRVAGHPQVIRHTAQQLRDAQGLWRRMVYPLEEHPGLWDELHVVAPGGGERATLTKIGSELGVFAPTRKGIHGQTVDLALIDEAWAFDEKSSRELMEAIRPSQITRRDRQLIIISAMGDDRSEWLENLIDTGRASITDPHSTMAYLEWSPDPSLDPYDPATWEFHPALGHLVTLQDLAGETSDHRNFLRSFMNRSIRDSSGPVDLTAWDNLSETPDPDATHQLAAFDVAIDSTAASIWTARVDDTGHQHLALVETGEGSDWLPQRLADLHAAGITLHAPATHAAAREIVDNLARANVPVTTWTAADESLAWTALTRRIKERTIRHDGATALRRALEVVRLPNTDNPAPSRRHSLGTIDALTAAQLASHAASRPRVPLQLFL